MISRSRYTTRQLRAILRSYEAEHKSLGTAVSNEERIARDLKEARELLYRVSLECGGPTALHDEIEEYLGEDRPAHCPNMDQRIHTCALDCELCGGSEAVPAWKARELQGEREG